MVKYFEEVFMDSALDLFGSGANRLL